MVMRASARVDVWTCSASGRRALSKPGAAASRYGPDGMAAAMLCKTDVAGAR